MKKPNRIFIRFDTPLPPQASEALAVPVERIGDYLVHPVAALFPMLQAEEYEKFKLSIEDQGQQVPIIVQDKVIIDGRNRMQACLDLGIEPLTEEYSSPLSVHKFIIAMNIRRRSLTQDQKTQLSDAAIRWAVADRNRQKQLTGKSEDGMAGGRGHKKQEPATAENLTPKSGEGLHDRHQRETAGQIAALAETSRYKAEQAIRVADHSPELTQQVIEGKISLKEADKQVPRKKKKPKAEPKPPTEYKLKVQQNAKERLESALAETTTGCGAALKVFRWEKVEHALTTKEARRWAQRCDDAASKLRRLAKKLRREA